MSAREAPLHGVRILDLTRVLAGPYCTLTLGDLGAEIVKIEESTKGDDTRSMHLSEQHGISSYFLGLNRNKKVSRSVSERAKGGKSFWSWWANPTS